MLGKIKLLVLLFAVPFMFPLSVYAATTPTYTSPNYQSTQIFFGSGGSLNQSSPNYEAKVTIGENGVGNYTGSNYQAYSGFNTTSVPFLQMVFTSSNVNLGVLSKSTTATATGSFYVRAWLAHGYQVIIASPPPQNEDNPSYYMCTYTTHTQCPTAPTLANDTGVEQFGVNLVADTTPSSFPTDSPASANPVQATVDGFGEAACMNGASYINADHACFNQTNSYNYGYNFSTQTGDVVAWSPTSSSSTIYTLSYVFNISNTTEDGTYNFNQDFVATATY